MTLEDILRTLQKRFWLILAGALTAGIVALVLSLVWPPSYKAETLLLITKLRSAVTLDPRFQTVAEEDIVNLSLQDEQVRRQTLVGLTQTPDLMSRLLDQLGDTISPHEQSVAFLKSATDASTQGNLIVFEAEADTPSKAAAIANTWAEVYRDQVNLLYSTTSPPYEQIQEQVNAAQVAYEAASNAVEEFVRSSAEDELTRQIEQKQQILADLQAGQLAAARQRVGSLLTRFNEIDQLSMDAQSLKAQLANSPASTTLTPGEEFALFRLEVGAFTSGAPFSVTLEFGVGWLGDVDFTAGQAIEKLDHLLATLEVVRATLQAEIADQSLALLGGEELLAYGPVGSGALDIAKLQLDINALKAELQKEQMEKQVLLDERNLAKDNYFTLARKATEVQILSQLTGVEVQIAAAAQEPEMQAFPRPLLTTALGVVAGGLVGLALAFFLEMRARLLAS